MLLEEGEERLEQHHVRLIASRSCAPHVLSRFELGSPGFWTDAWTIFPPCVVQGRVAISHSPSSSVKRSPSWSCMGSVAGGCDGPDGVLRFGLTSSARAGPRCRGGSGGGRSLCD